MTVTKVRVIRDEKEIEIDKNKIKNYLEKGKTNYAKLYAENVIKKKNIVFNLIKTSVMIEATAMKLKETYMIMKSTKSMDNIISLINNASKKLFVTDAIHMIEEFSDISKTLGIKNQYLNDTLTETTSTETDNEDVNILLSEIIDQNDLKIENKFKKIPIVNEKKKIEIEEPELKIKEKKKEKIMILVNSNKINNKKNNEEKEDHEKNEKKSKIIFDYFFDEEFDSYLDEEEDVINECNKEKEEN